MTKIRMRATHAKRRKSAHSPTIAQSEPRVAAGEGAALERSDAFLEPEALEDAHAHSEQPSREQDLGVDCAVTEG